MANLIVQPPFTKSSELAGIISDETGSGVLVFGTSPAFTTSIITPLVIGGTATTSDLSLQTTSGVGTTSADMHFLVGNNGATEAMTILNSGNVGIGTTGPSDKLEVAGGNLVLTDDDAWIGASSGNNLFWNDSSGHGVINAKKNIYLNIDSNNNDADTAALYIGKNAATTGSTGLVTILESGNVGIGTTGPGARLGFAAATTAAGGIDFGGDVTLYRGAANELRTDDMIESVRASSTDNAFLTWVTGDSNNRWYVTADGTMRWGPGNASVDTNLYRGAANILQTDDGLNIAGNVGIGTTSPTNLLSLGGNSTRIFWLERHTTANTAGNTLTITAGGATVAATDKAGGDLILTPGLSTGTGESGVQIKGVPAGSTGTADGTQTLGIQVLGNKIGFYAVTPVVRPTALTTQLTTVTCTAPGTPDYAIADLTTTSPYGFVSADEGQSVLKVIANLQTRVAELETKLTALGLLT